MYYKVKIKKLPNKELGGTKTGQQNSDGSLAIQPTAMGGADIDQYIGKPDLSVKKTLNKVPRDKANLEAEGGETAYGDINGDGMLEHYNIEGPRHNAGGVPLNLPDDSFIYSDFVKMKIKDPDILAKFGKGKSSKSYTPAQLAKQYDINKYRQILQDPNSDSIDKKTAEIMIKNYNMKLGALALAQEGGKAFPQGIPEVAKPFMEANGISEEQILPKKPQPVPTQMPSGEPIAQAEEMMPQQPMAMYGMSMGGYDMPFAQEGGYISQFLQKGGAPYSEAEGYSPQGVERLNMYRKMYGLPQLKGSVTKADIQKAAGELQSKIIEANPELVVDYMSRTSHQPNKALLAKIPSGYEKTTEGVRQAFEDGKLSAEDIRKAYKDDKWWYRALETQQKKLSKAEYEAKMKEKGAIKQNDKLYFQDDPDNPQLYTEYIMEEGQEPDVTTTTTEEEQEGERPDITNPEFAQQPRLVLPEWTGVDKTNFYGTLKDKYSIKKYYPWAPRYEPEVPRPTFLDPTRELAQQSEQANILTQGLGQFVGPQALSARASAIQGQGAEQAANTLGRYNNANVNIADQFALNAANIRNQAQLQNQGIAKQLYDQTTFTNQQYDNSMRQANQAVKLAKMTGDQNAINLALTNATSDQYDIDPSTGALIFTGGKQHTPEIAKDFNYWLEEYKTQGMSDKDAIAAAKIAIGQGGGGYTGPDIDTMMSNMAQRGLIVTGPMAYPFYYD